MRNLKKVLSLALALVMLLGMMVVGAGAATSFKDDDKIDNQVAVAVSNKIGVLVGDENGNFNPDGTLTRAEAAVAIARLDLGASAADALAATNAATFKDVPVTHWGKPYIDYCAGNGYIVGDGNGNFNPNKTVTSVEFATMVARMLGYNTKNEGIEGNADWAVKAAALARKAGLSTNVVLTTADAMPRDDMAQMVFNSLTAPMVEYDGLNVSVNGVAITSNVKVRTHTGSSLGSVNNTTYDYEAIKANITPIRLCEEKFPDLKLTKQTYDAFGRTYSVWKWKNVEIAGSSTQVAPDASFHASTLESAVSSATNNASASSARVYINGKSSVEAVDAAKIAGWTQNGRLVQVYLNDSNKKLVDKVVVIDTYVAHVNSVSKAGTDDRYITLNVYDKNVLKPLDKTFETADFAVGDLVTYKAAYDSKDEMYYVQEVAPLEVSATATLEKWVGSNLTSEKDKGTSNASFTADGQKYSYSRNNVIVDENGDSIVISDFTAGKSEINIYLDEYEYAIYVSGVEAAKNYAAVIGVGKSNQYGSETRGATLLLPDGTTKEVIAKIAGGNDWTVLMGTKINPSAPIANVGNLKKDGTDYENLYSDGVADIVTYTVGDDNLYTLNLVGKSSTTPATYTGNYTEDKVEFTTGKSQMKIGAQTGLYTTSRTVFMIGVKEGSTYIYSAFTGYAAAPGIKWEKVNGVSYGLNDKYTKQIDVVYIDAKEVEGITTAKTYFVFNSAKFNITTNGTNKFYTLPAVVDGEVTEINIDAALALKWNGGSKNVNLRDADPGLYVIKNVKKDKNDVIVDAILETSEFGIRNGKAGTIRANGEVLGFGEVNGTGSTKDEYWAYGDGTKVYTIDKDYKSITASNVEAVATDKNDAAYASWDSNKKQLAKVFIVDVPDDTTGNVDKDADGTESVVKVNDDMTIDVTRVDNDTKIASKILAAVRAKGYKTPYPVDFTAGTDGAVTALDADGDLVGFDITITDKYTISVDGVVREVVAKTNTINTNATADTKAKIDAGKGTGVIVSFNAETASPTYTYKTKAVAKSDATSITGKVDIKTGYVSAVTDISTGNTTTGSTDAGVFKKVASTVAATGSTAGVNDWFGAGKYLKVGDKVNLTIELEKDSTRFKSSKVEVTGALTGTATIDAEDIQKGNKVVIELTVGNVDLAALNLKFTEGPEVLEAPAIEQIDSSKSPELSEALKTITDKIAAADPSDLVTPADKANLSDALKSVLPDGASTVSKDILKNLPGGCSDSVQKTITIKFNVPEATGYLIVIRDKDGKIVFADSTPTMKVGNQFIYFSTDQLLHSNPTWPVQGAIDAHNAIAGLVSGEAYSWTIYKTAKATASGTTECTLTDATEENTVASDVFTAP